MLGNSVINIVTNPMRLWLLKLEAMLSTNSGWKSMPNKNGRAVLVRIHGHNHLYVSPTAKLNFIQEFNPEYKPDGRTAFKTQVLHSIDKVDAFLVKCIDKIKSRLKLGKSPSTNGTLFSDDFGLGFNNEFMTKRKKTIDKIKKGKFADRMDALNKAELKIAPPLKEMDLKFKETMKSQMMTVDTASESSIKESIDAMFGTPVLQQKFTDILNNTLRTRSSSNIENIKKGMLASKVEMFDKAKIHDDIPAISKLDKSMKEGIRKSMNSDAINKKHGPYDIDLDPDKYGTL